MPLCLPGRVTGEQAALHFSRPRFWNLYGLLAPSVHVADASSPETKILPFVECLWLPAYAVCLHSVSGKGERRIWTSVDGISGEVTLFDAVDEMIPQEPTEERFPAEIDEVKAIDLSRKGVLRYVMVQRGQLNKPTVDAVLEVRPYCFAVWVYYYRRRRKSVDIKVLDSCTGKSAGAKMRMSVINALVAAKRRRNQAQQ